MIAVVKMKLDKISCIILFLIDNRSELSIILPIINEKNISELKLTYLVKVSINGKG
jgi:hypothetical protein